MKVIIQGTEPSLQATKEDILYLIKEAESVGKCTKDLYTLLEKIQADEARSEKQRNENQSERK